MTAATDFNPLTSGDVFCHASRVLRGQNIAQLAAMAQTAPLDLTEAAA